MFQNGAVGETHRDITYAALVQQICVMLSLRDSGKPGMPEKKPFIRATISLDRDDYAALGQLAARMDISASWLVRQAIREFLDKYGEHGQPELALRLADKRKG